MTMTSPVRLPEITDERPLIDVDDVKRLIRQAVKERGADYVDTGGRYADYLLDEETGTIHNATPSCIVGQVLYDLGAPANELPMMPLPLAFGLENRPHHKPLPARFTPAAEFLLGQAMNANDAGAPWGRIADELAAE